MKRWIQRAIVIALATTLSFAAAAATAADTPPPFRIVGRQLPLPPGPWRVAVRDIRPVTLPRADGDSSAFSVERVVLVRESDDGSVEALVVAQANIEKSRSGWGLPSRCHENPSSGLGRQDASADILYESRVDGLCVMVEPPAVGSASLGWLAGQLPLARTEAWWSVAVRVTNRRDMLDVRYVMAPPTLTGNPDTVGARLRAWGKMIAGSVALGAKNRLPGDAGLTAPWDEASSRIASPDADGMTAPATVWSRRYIDELRQSGALDDGEAETASRAVEAAAAPVSASASASAPDGKSAVGWPAIYRFATYRLSGAVMSAGVNYAFLADAYLASAIYGVNVVISSAMFYVNEVVWNRIDDDGNKERQPVFELPVTDGGGS